MKTQIWYTEEITDKRGRKWYRINGDTSYPLDQWTKEEAEADYNSEKATLERQIDFMRANGFYD